MITLGPVTPIKRLFNHLERDFYNNSKYKLSLFDTKYNFFMHESNLPHIKKDNSICFKIHDDTKVIGYLVKGTFHNLSHIY